jgi:SAM-dependent methyltransferase
MASRERVCDALVVCFSEGVTLRTWEESGILGREWSLYERLRERVGKVVLVTCGGGRDREIAAALGTTVVCGEEENKRRGEEEVVAEVVRAIGGARRVVVKTNQMSGGEVALAIVAGLRGHMGLGSTDQSRSGPVSGTGTNSRVALVARGGYLWSRFEAMEFGAESERARGVAEREGRLCRGADVVVGTTLEMVDDLAWRHGIEAGRVVVVPNYVDVGCGMSDVGCGERDTATVLFAGRLEAQKRVAVLIEAMAMLAPEVRERARLVVVGSGTLEEKLRARAAELGAPVEFVPRMPHAELMVRMRACCIYAQASAYEGHPKTVLEAMGAGAPAVVADAPGLRGVVRQGITGLCVPGEARAFAMALEALLRDREWREALGRGAAAQIGEECSLERVAEMEIAVYEKAMSGEHGLPLRAAAKPWHGTEVRWEPALLAESTDAAVAKWARSVGGFARRLEPKERAKFLAGLDTPLYHMQGEVAVEAEGGLHPKHRVMRYHDFFVDRIKAGERVIDLGCGVGALASSIAERSGARVVGMDWSEKNLEKAKQRSRGAEEQRREGGGGSLEFLKGDITRDRAPGRFDVVVLSNVLEHLTDRPACLRRWREWYEPKRILIRVPAFDREWRVPWKKELGVEWRLDPTHETEYTQGQLKQEMREAGLRVTDGVGRWGEYWVSAEPA